MLACMCIVPIASTFNLVTFVGISVILLPVELLLEWQLPLELPLEE